MPIRTHTRRRLYYVPGLLTLLALPFLLIQMQKWQQQKARQRVMSVHFWVPGRLLNYSAELGSQGVDTTFPANRNRNYLKITLTGSDTLDQVKLAYAQLRIREIIAENNSTHGLNVHFEKGVTYDSFVRILDICKIEHARTYWFHEHDLWFWHEPEHIDPKLLTTFNFSCLLCDDVVNVVIDDRTTWEKIRNQALRIVNSSGFLIFGFLVLLLQTLLNGRSPA